MDTATTGQRAARSVSAKRSAHHGEKPARRAENAAARALAPTIPIVNLADMRRPDSPGDDFRDFSDLQGGDARVQCVESNPLYVRARSPETTEMSNEMSRFKATAHAHMQEAAAAKRKWVCDCEACVNIRSL